MAGTIQTLHIGVYKDLQARQRRAVDAYVAAAGDGRVGERVPDWT